MESLFGAFIYVFAALLPIVNPIGAAMFFMSMTANIDAEARNILSFRIGIYCFLMTVVSLYAGAFILSYFGISIGVLRVAGGMVLVSAGWGALNAPSREEVDEQPQKKKETRTQLMKKAFYPFTLPLTIGPGAIAVSTALGSSLPGDIVDIAGAILAALACSASVWICFRYSDRITKAMGSTGADALARIFAFILVCLGVQIFWTGFTELWLSLPRN